MYEIMLKTWYQETPNKTFVEAYNNLEFDSMELACEYFTTNYEKILDEFPIQEITIKNKYK